MQKPHRLHLQIERLYRRGGSTSKNSITINAGNDTNLTAAQNTDHETNNRERKQSGFSFSSSSIGYSKSKLNTNSDTQTTTHTASTVGSINGNVDINAGLGGKTGSYTQTGSDVLATNANHSATGGNIDISAQNVTILACLHSHTIKQ